MPVMGTAPAFSAWLDDFFASYYRHRPVNATFVGVHEHDDRLPDYSDTASAMPSADAEVAAQPAGRAAAGAAGRGAALDRRLAEGFLRIQRWEYDSPHFRWQTRASTPARRSSA